MPLHHCCFEDGVCMTLSRYFEKMRQKDVDWVTLYFGITTLRTSLGYNCSKQEHALIALLEYQLENALTTFLKLKNQDLEPLFFAHKGYNDYILNGWESRMVYLYLLKTAAKRRKELLFILKSFDPYHIVKNKEYTEQFNDYHISDLDYDVGKKFEYEL
nr:hypothetical protein [Vibrio sp. 04Ya108]